MDIAVATDNQVKIEAVKEALACSQLFKEFNIVQKAISSGVSELPRSLEETISGAVNRARSAFESGVYKFGIGLEGGLMEVPQAKSGLMVVEVCVIFDGSKTHLGFSPAFENHEKAVNFIIEKNMGLIEAYLRAGLTSNPKLGHSEGVVGLLTKGKVTRKEYIKLSVWMALIHLENETETK